MTEVNVGIYELGYDNVQLILSPGRSGSFSLNPNKSMPCIRVGGEYTKWQNFYAVLLHEAFEFALTRKGCRYVDTQDLSCETGAFVFSLSHAQFSDCCAMASEFLTSCHKDLKVAWIKNKIANKIGLSNMVTVDPPKEESNE